MLISVKIHAQKWTVAYTGNNLWNPGLALEYYHLVNAYYKINKKDKKQLIIKSARFEAGTFVDPDAFTFTYINVGYSSQRIYPNGRWTAIKLSPFGAARTFLPSTFHVNQDGSVSQETFPGRMYFAPALDWQFGLFKNNGILNRVFIGSNLMVLLPYNTYAMPLLNFRIGYQIQKHN
jgi:hypothetical protein